MTICKNLQTIGQRIRAAEQQYGRTPNSVQLLAVSKFHPQTAIESALACGQYAFGENYAQELVDKAQPLAHHASTQPIEWHFIGPLQTNKTKLVAQTASWVHSIDRFKIAQRLSEQRLPTLPPLNICLQINISAEASKSGVQQNEVLDLAQQVAKLPHLRLRGLMAIPAPEHDFERLRATFAQVRYCQEQLMAQGLALDTLSMGMSDDLEAAIAEGATIVRVGTAIFGARPKPL